MKKKIIDNTHLFKARENKKREHHEQVERHNALFGARKVWEKWCKRVVIQMRKPEELPILLNELAAELEKEVKQADIRKTTVEMVHGKLVEIYGRQKLMEAVVRVLVDCPHKVSGHVPEIDCGWGGQAFFGKSVWDEGKAEMRCPECSNQLTQKDMILSKDMEEIKANLPKVNRIAKYVPSRVAKNKPPEVFKFTTVEELKALPFVRSAMEEKYFIGFSIVEKYFYARYQQFKKEDVELKVLGIIEHPELVRL